MATKKMVKKPVMKKGGVKKPLRKAKNGEPVGPYMISNDVPKSKDKNIYQGPLTERDTKQLDENYPATVGKGNLYGRPAVHGNKKQGYISNEANEKYYRRNDENYLRSNDPTVQKWNANQSYGGDYPQTSNANFKKGGAKKMKTGGAMKKYEVGGMTESESCGKPGKPRCKKTFKSKGKSKETKGSLLGTIGAGILGSLGGYAAYKKLKEQKKGGATKYKTGGMVNPNAKLQAAKSAGSDGVKSGVNPKASASKVAKGRSGGTSAAPKTATPKAKYGMAVKRKK